VDGLEYVKRFAGEAVADVKRAKKMLQGVDLTRREMDDDVFDFGMSAIFSCSKLLRRLARQS